MKLSDAERRHLDHDPIPLGSEQEIADAFHRLSYDAARRQLSWWAARFRGFPVYKWPGDLWLYLELVQELRPRTIIETGTADGGSALFFAALLDWVGARDGTVVTIDIKPLDPRWPHHDRIVYVPGRDSREGLPRGLARADGVRLPQALQEPVMVVLDSDHARDHVLAELDAYAPLVSVGSYLVVEDTNVNGHPALKEHGPGPWEAVEAWLPAHPEYREDLARPAKFLFSYHRWLRRVS